MNKPDYRDWNLVNLISSIKWFCWIESKSYPYLKELTPEYLSAYRNVVLFLIDWLGYEWINKYAQWSFLHSKMRGKLKTIFPTTTSSAITTINTWLTPSEHSVLWWNMYCKEAGSIIKILPWEHKILWVTLGTNLKISDIVDKKPFYQDCKNEAVLIFSDEHKEWEYNSFYTVWATKLPHSWFESFFDKVSQILNFDMEKRYIFAYWSEFDSISHDKWNDSLEVKKHYDEIDEAFRKLYEKNWWKDTLFIVTADHWQTIVRDENKIDMRSVHPKLCEMLVMPMAWEPRFQYCFVKEWRKEDFERYVKSNLQDICILISKEEALESSLFWEWKDERFLERIWDYILMPKPWYAIFDEPIWKRVKSDIWYHWWLTPDELNIPLIVME